MKNQEMKIKYTYEIEEAYTSIFSLTNLKELLKDYLYSGVAIGNSRDSEIIETLNVINDDEEALKEWNKSGYSTSRYELESQKRNYCIMEYALFKCKNEYNEENGEYEVVESVEIARSKWDITVVEEKTQTVIKEFDNYLDAYYYCEDLKETEMKKAEEDASYQPEKFEVLY